MEIKKDIADLYRVPFSEAFDWRWGPAWKLKSLGKLTELFKSKEIINQLK